MIAWCLIMRNIVIERCQGAKKYHNKWFHYEIRLDRTLAAAEEAALMRFTLLLYEVRMQRSDGQPPEL
jgi:hypothetical protein